MSGKKGDARYPFADLAAAMRMTEAQAARALDLAGSTAQEYRRKGVTERVADRLAVKAGLHPMNVWPNFSDDVEAERLRLRREASNRYSRKVRATAEGAEANRVRRRAYYAEYGHYERARERAKYARSKAVDAA